MGVGVQGGGVGRTQGDHAAAETTPAHAGTEDTGLAQQVLDELVDGGDRHQVVGGQAAVTLGHDLAHSAQIAPLEPAFRLEDPGALRDDVPGPPPEHGVGQRAQVAQGTQAERSPELLGRPLALVATGGVGRVGQEAGCLAVHDDECRLCRHHHWPGLEGVEIDMEGMSRGGARDGEGIEQSDVGAREALGLLLGTGQGEGFGVVAEGEQQGDREGRTRREAGTDGDGAGDRDRTAAAVGWGAEPQEGGRQEGVRRQGGGERPGGAAEIGQGDLERRVGELVGLDADEEAARFRREADLGGQVDGHGEGEAPVVVGVVADDGDAAGGTGGGHEVQLGPPPGGVGTWAIGSPPPHRRRDQLDRRRGAGHDPAMTERSGPLRGIKIIELAGIGPGPFTCMMLADAGASVLRLERAAHGAVEIGAELQKSGRPAAWDLLNRSRPSVGIDLKHPDAVSLILDLVEQADGLVEGFRPGVAERLGLGPEVCLERNPRFVYGRMTGWGQDGPMAALSGHDIDYISIGGALWSMGRADSAPVPPLNMVGDFGGGGMLLAFGMVAALLEAARSGEGQVVDAAMTDGSAVLMTMIHAFRLNGLWNEERGANMLDTGAPFYEVYETSDGQWMGVGAIEGKFYALLLEGLGLTDDASLPAQMSRQDWPAMKQRFAAIFKTKTRDEWSAIFDGTDACVAPVLSPWEAHLHPHNVARSTFIEVDGVTQPAPAPRFSRTPSAVSKPPSPAGADTVSALVEWGVEEDTVTKLRESGALS